MEKGAVEMNRPRRISKGQFEEIITKLIQVSQETLNRDRILTRDELLEYARWILDMAEVDYTTLAGM